MGDAMKHRFKHGDTVFIRNCDLSKVSSEDGALIRSSLFVDSLLDARGTTATVIVCGQAYGMDGICRPCYCLNTEYGKWWFEEQHLEPVDEPSDDSSFFEIDLLKALTP